MPFARFHLSLKIVLLLTGLCACARDQDRVQPGDTPPEEPATRPAVDTNNVSVLSNPDTAAWTVGLTAKGGTGMTTLLEVRTASHAEYERIVFVFGPEGLSGYKVEYIDRPVRQCGSGEVVDLPGDAWLSIRLEPAQAHTEAGAPTVAERSRTLDYQNIKALKLICDFEGQVEWVAGVASPTRYRTLELKAPPRLVVDVRK